MVSPNVMPPLVPPPQAAGHSFEQVPLSRDRARDQGESRRRPRFRSSPQTVQVSWALTQEEFDALDTFFHGTLLAGELDFDLQVHQRGSSFAREWFTARWVSPYAWDVGTQDEGGLAYRVQATLWLLESLGESRVSPGIRAAGADVDTGRALAVPGPLVASGIDADSGRALVRDLSTMVYGTDVDEGGWAGALWTPELLPVEPDLWADNVSALTAVSGACSQWNDRSGNGYHLVQGTANRRPAVNAAGLNGRRTLTFDGAATSAADHLFNDSAGLRDVGRNRTGLSQVVVYRKTASDAGVARLVTYLSSNASGSRFSLSCSNVGAANLTRGVVRRLDADSVAELVQPASLGGDWQIVVLNVDYSTGAGRLLVNGVAEDIDAALTSSGSTSDTRSIAAFAVGASRSHLTLDPTAGADVQVFAVLLVPAALSPEDEARLTGWAAHSAGLQDLLPVDHPYRTSPPLA
jgi:hypothetical protein